MEMRTTIFDETRAYWTGRAPGYSDVNKQELSTAQRRKWKECLEREISGRFPDRPASSLHVLDVGTGPGFFAILLCEAGYQVTAVDLTRAMLREAEVNAGSLGGRIHFMEMNAENLLFGDSCFDVVVTRNLTWNLPHPEKAYAEWIRVLKPGGLLLNFDANWYAYLFDEKAKKAYEQDRVISAEKGITDRNIGENFDIMEGIARRIPLSAVRRPGWDLEVLGRSDLHAEACEEIWEQVWSEEEKTNFASTPLFMIRGRKRYLSPT